MPPAAVPSPADIAADRAAGKVEELGEISSSTAGAPPIRTGQPCDLANCGVILAIYQGKPQLDVQPDWDMYPPYPYYSGMAPYYWPSPYVGAGLDAWDTPMGPYSGGYVMATTPLLWHIEVQMNSGSKRIIQQNYEPLLHLGDPVLVEGNNIRLWN